MGASLIGSFATPIARSSSCAGRKTEASSARQPRSANEELKATIAATKSVITMATRSADVSSRASGTSSEKTIQTIAPPANPRPMGKSGAKSPDEHEGDSHQRLSQAREDAPERGAAGSSPRGTRTRLIASPSGRCVR